MIDQQFLAALTPQARDEPDSGIVKAAMHGFTVPGVIALWAGEGNQPTPEAFARPAAEALLNGETFYTWQRGIPELRDALARYHTRHFGRRFDHENFFVTSGGMHAIQTVVQLIAGEGDEIVLPAPAWPNYAGVLRISGAKPVEVQMQFANGRWTLDLDRLFDAVTPRTRAIALNSPSNPVGWTATRDELVAVRDFCRKRGLWILGDEVYTRFYYGENGETRAPSFLDICGDGERLLLANTFSKNWAMTGWRVGWLQAPKALGPAIERIVQVSSSGTPAFLQRGCVAALDHGDGFIERQVLMARHRRDLTVLALKELPGLQFEVPQGAFYLFFGIAGMTDSAAAVRRLIDEAKVGFAPGSAFGAGGEGHLRMCYLKDLGPLEEALSRFVDWMRKNRPV
ncbi:pyridoxal phosphate-dependent aminotransferase [Aestuariivirga sp.]|uniref:pyridoxal phosphate-dependent aminotransferase n=1 Tax=Aestuariivirga sp. TaxID=2650926 RepID=UPI0025B8F13B|nr:pyridoxal phosphate-dependent aminotransferase [Aestuariivirga sp.]MCA3555360.1 pyridoxal phosphate-dependent aminotransferase [Aestuariivirga sp.]